MYEPVLPKCPQVVYLCANMDRGGGGGVGTFLVEAKASVYCRFFVAFLLTSCVSVVFCVNMLCLFGKREENKRNPYHRVLHLSVLVLFVMVGVAVYF